MEYKKQNPWDILLAGFIISVALAALFFLTGCTTVRYAMISDGKTKQVVITGHSRVDMSLDHVGKYVEGLEKTLTRVNGECK